MTRMWATSYLTNHGVSLLQDERTHQAILTFKEAMCEAHYVATQQEPKISFTFSSSTLNARSLHRPQEQQQQQQQAHEDSSSSSSAKIVPIMLREASPMASPHNTFALYENAFYLENMDNTLHSSNNQEEEEDSNFVLINAALLYNIGLAHHRLGVTEIEDSTKNLRHALRYYKLAMSAIRQNTQHKAAHQSAQLFLIVLALFNNMGHIFSHFCRQEEATSCRQHLDVLLNSNSISTNIFLTNEDAEFFYVEKLARSASVCYNAAAPCA